MNKKGGIAINKTIGMILVLLALMTLVLFTFFLKDKGVEIVEVIKNLVKI